ncbi:hypothetical protein LIER_03894 [Lithospermum erythrorhizon]|uniref:RNase H type-1 domain-containing protein n=1 Tax=Lithospermum erythrorhizon TaxID=34254 RepID=A0AAV3NWI6_LITER
MDGDSRPSWQPVGANSLKCKCDGRWNKESLIGSTGVVCRDSDGVFRGASYRRLKEGLHLVWKLKCRKVELESDSKTLIHILKGDQVPSRDRSGSCGYCSFDKIYGGNIPFCQATAQQCGSYYNALGGAPWCTRSGMVSYSTKMAKSSPFFHDF